MATGIADLVYQSAKRDPEKVAIVCGDTTLTYREFACLSMRLAEALKQRGVEAGDRIFLISNNSVKFAAILIAAADLGAVLAPVSTGLSIDAFLAGMKAISGQHVIAEEQTLASLKSAAPTDLQIENWICLNETSSDCFSLEAAMNVIGLDVQPQGQGAAELPFILTMTSGSTGQPKPIVLTQRAKIERAAALTALYEVDGSDTILAATPMYHSLAQRLVLTPLINGGTAIVMPQYSVRNWLEAVAIYQVSFTILVSSQIVAITKYVEKNQNDDHHLSTLRVLVSSSAALKIEDKRRALNVFSCDIHECYGASEIAIATSLKLSLEQSDLGSVGFAAPDVDILILSEDGKPCPLGDVGEISCRTPMLFGGYYDQPEKTSDAMHGEYFKTGDLGRLDDRGALYFCGRKKDVIIVGGINVYPTDIENIVFQLPGVSSCAAFSMESDALGEVPALAIVKDLEGDEGDVTPRIIRRECSKKLADFQCPQRIVFLDALPTNPMGKLMRRELETKYGSKDWKQAI